jgi:glycine/D-amino acid oxidase-like deaminating enzyme
MITSSRPASDVVIVGGGISGTSLTWQLTRRGWQTFTAWPELVRGEPVHTTLGLIVTFDTAPGHEGNVERLPRNVALHNSLGIPSCAVTRDELRDLQPQAAWADVSHAAYEPDSGYVDAIAATHGMAHAARAAGADILDGTPVHGIETSQDRVRGMRTSDGIVPAKTVVVAAGPWTPRLVENAGVHVPIEALRVQVAIVQHPLAVESHLVSLDTAARIFARPWAPGRGLIGFGGDQHDPVDPDTHDPGNDRGAFRPCATRPTCTVTPDSTT